jgi:hypothetical protein
VGVVLPAAVAAAPREASACGTAVYLAGERPSRRHRPAPPSPTLLVAQAEQALSEGKHVAAATKALLAFPALKIVQPGTLPLADRALRILALASARTDGALTAGSFSGGSAADRAANLAWSIAVLRALEAQRVNNPSYRTDLGEVLARVPEHHAEAARILGELADKDLLTSAEGYAALARLRAEGGDRAAQADLVKRCETMTKTPAICALPSFLSIVLTDHRAAPPGYGRRARSVPAARCALGSLRLAARPDGRSALA